MEWGKVRVDSEFWKTSGDMKEQVKGMYVSFLTLVVSKWDDILACKQEFWGKWTWDLTSQVFISLSVLHDPKAKVWALWRKIIFDASPCWAVLTPHTLQAFFLLRPCSQQLQRSAICPSLWTCWTYDPERMKVGQLRASPSFPQSETRPENRQSNPDKVEGDIEKKMSTFLCKRAKTKIALI